MCWYLFATQTLGRILVREDDYLIDGAHREQAALQTGVFMWPASIISKHVPIFALVRR